MLLGPMGVARGPNVTGRSEEKAGSAKIPGMSSSEQLSVNVTVDGHTIQLLERQSSEDETIYRLSVDRNRPVFVSLVRWYPPGLGYHKGRLAIWTGMRLCCYDCETGDLSSFKMDDEVHAVYGVGDRWCLVCELSVVLFDVQLGQEVAVYYHGEVLMESWWESGRLFVEDFEGRTVQLDLGPEGSELVPVEG